MSSPLHLFTGYGIEIEYMIIDRNSCRIKPVAELLLTDDTGEVANEVEHGPLCWSNELVQHVIEVKTNGPASSLRGLADIFLEHVRRINSILAPHDCMLLPGATHPFMDPTTETSIWERENTEIYQTFNGIFNCQGHGWSNLQSMHINLPFCGEDEFFRLHNAIRIILPLIPALSASSPFQDGRDTGHLDCRMTHYGKNCARIPSVTGLIVPEPVATPAEYQSVILETIYNDLKPYDPQSILQQEWANARGAIARFDRGAIEIRVIDSQECPAADLAVAELICGAVKTLTQYDANLQAAMQRLATQQLHRQLMDCVTHAENAQVVNREFRSLLRLPEHVQTAGQVWQQLAGSCDHISPAGSACLDVIFKKGSLATRMRRGTGKVTAESLRRLCQELSGCLQSGHMYNG